jgi:hypothetical protein
MIRLVRGVSLLMAAALLTGCGTFLKLSIDPIVNANFPPVDITSERNAAVATAAIALQQVKNPALLLTADAQSVKEQLFANLQNLNSGEIAVRATSISLGQQSIVFGATVDGRLQASGIQFQAQITGESIIALKANGAGYVRPVFTSARLSKVHLDQFSFAAGPTAKLINAALKRYLDNINGALPEFVFQIEPDDVGLSTSPSEIDLPGGRKIKIPAVALGSTALLIDSDGIHAIAEITVSPLVALASAPNQPYDSYRQDFVHRAEPVFGSDSLKKSGIFLSDEVLKAILVDGLPPAPLSDLQRLALSDLNQWIGSARTIAGGLYFGNDILEKYVETISSGPLGKFSSKELQIGALRARLDEQSILIEAPISGEISGNIAYKAKLTIAAVLAPKMGGGLEVRPALASLVLDRVEHLGKKVDPLGFVASINRLLDQLVPYLNSALADHPIKVELPTLEEFQIPQTANIAITPSTLRDPASKPLVVLPRIRADQARFLIVEAEGILGSTEAGFQARDRAFSVAVNQVITKAFDTSSRLALPPPLPLPPNSAPVDASYDALWSRAGLGTVNSVDLGGAVSLPWLSGKLGRLLSENSVVVTATSESSVTMPSAPLSKPPLLSVSCDIGDSCTRGSCNRGTCARTDSCNWDCQRCVNVGLGNWCTDEPICLAGRLACNTREEAKVAACNISEEAKVGVCNAAEETKLAACNIERNLKLAQCNLTNEIINGINGLANLGDLGGSSRVTTSARVSNLAATYDLNSASLIFTANANLSVQASGDLNYTPKGIGSLLICPIGGQVSYTVNGNFGGGGQPLVARLRPRGVSAGLSPAQIEFSLDPVRIQGKISPPPIEAILVQNPQIQVTCSPVLTGPLNSIAVLGKISAFTPIDIVKAIEDQLPSLPAEARAVIDVATKGTVDQQIAIPPIFFSLGRMSLLLGEVEVILTPQWSQGSLILAK